METLGGRVDVVDASTGQEQLRREVFPHPRSRRRLTRNGRTNGAHGRGRRGYGRRLTRRQGRLHLATVPLPPKAREPSPPKRSRRARKLELTLLVLTRALPVYQTHVHVPRRAHASWSNREKVECRCLLLTRLETTAKSNRCRGRRRGCC